MEFKWNYNNINTYKIILDYCQDYYNKLITSDYQNILEDFCKQIIPQIAPKKRHLIPELPKMRNLDISEVLKSEYFCS